MSSEIHPDVVKMEPEEVAVIAAHYRAVALRAGLGLLDEEALC